MVPEAAAEVTRGQVGRACTTAMVKRGGGGCAGGRREQVKSTGVWRSERGFTGEIFGGVCSEKRVA